MPSANPWIVCETSGRWAAALRVALASQTVHGTVAPRIYEVRSLAELTTALNEYATALAFVEVRADNFSQILNLLTTLQRPKARFVALADRSSHPDCQAVADALCEAGAADVIASPRKLHSALQLAELHAATAAKRAVSVHDLASIADLAWAALPWQDG